MLQEFHNLAFVRSIGFGASSIMEVPSNPTTLIAPHLPLQDKSSNIAPDLILANLVVVSVLFGTHLEIAPTASRIVCRAVIFGFVPSDRKIRHGSTAATS